MGSGRFAAVIAAFVLVVGTVNAYAESEQAKEAALDQAADAHNAQIADPQEQVVCEWEAQTGTRIKKKVCRTQSVIEQERKDARRFITKPRPVFTDE
jgi:hypothetical protein